MYGYTVRIFEIDKIRYYLEAIYRSIDLAGSNRTTGNVRYKCRTFVDETGFVNVNNGRLRDAVRSPEMLPSL